MSLSSPGLGLVSPLERQDSSSAFYLTLLVWSQGSTSVVHIMNPYSNTALPFLSDVTLSIPNLPSSPSVPSPPRYSPPTPSDRSEPLHSNDPTVTVHNRTSAPSENLSPHNNLDQTLQSDSSNPYPPDSGQISIISDSFSDQIPDLECSICFSQFNNAFRCPKMLQCKHTFCLECLARMNVKSTEPSAILCPLCRGLTPLPTLGLPKLDTDPEVLSCLPAAMQRVYSVRFVRNKGRLQLKRSLTLYNGFRPGLDPFKSN